jgi:hypothetical protein
MEMGSNRWMGTAVLGLAALAAFVAACAGVDDWSEPNENPVAIRQGLAGMGTDTFDLQQNWVGLGGTYNGATDALIVSTQATNNFGALATCAVIGTASQEYACVMRWDMPPPNTATVTAASIILTLASGTTGTYNVYQLLKPWNEGEVTWNKRTALANWTLAGAKQTTGGTPDRSATVLGTLTGATGQRTITLNASGIAVVQSWVTNSATNHGLIIAGTSPDNAAFRSSEYPTVAERPILRVTYNF